MAYGVSVRRIDVPGAITAVDLTDDGEHVAVALDDRKDGAPIQVFRTSDGTLVGEMGPPRHQGKGVAFLDGGKLLACCVHSLAGATLFSSRGGSLEKFAEYPNDQARTLVRARDGRRLGICGDSFLVWDAKMRDVVAHVLGDCEAAGHFMIASFASAYERVFLYGKAKGRIVLHDLKTDEDVESWPAPYEFGAFLTTSPSDRYLVAVGYSGRGVTVLDTRDGSTSARDFFDPEWATNKFPVFSYDERVLFTWAGNAWFFDIPGFEWHQGGPVPGRRTTAAASATNAPLLAFGIDENAVVLVRLDV